MKGGRPRKSTWSKLAPFVFIGAAVTVLYFSVSRLGRVEGLSSDTFVASGSAGEDPVRVDSGKGAKARVAAVVAGDDAVDTAKPVKAKVPALPWVQEAKKKVATYKLGKPSSEAKKGTITLVTCLFDLGRGSIGTSFVRSFSMYTDHIKAHFMKINMPKIIYIEESTFPMIKDGMDNETEIRYRTLKDIEALLGPGNWEKLSALRTNEQWYDQGWLRDSPQARLAHYNAVVMTKLFLMDDAATDNPFKTDYFVWIDAKHNCINEVAHTYDKMGVLFEHMNNAFVMTYYKYGPAPEVHGFKWDAFNRYIARQESDMTQVKVVRGGIFGGTPEVVHAVAEVYMMALTASLTEGFMGTEENIYSICLYNLPELFREFSNDDACATGTNWDRSCHKFRNTGGNCAIFDWMYRGPTVPPPRQQYGGDKWAPTGPGKSKHGAHQYWRLRVAEDGGAWEWAVHEIEMYTLDNVNLLHPNYTNDVSVSSNRGGSFMQAVDDDESTFWDLPDANDDGTTLLLDARKPVEIYGARVLQHGHRDNSVTSLAIEYADDPSKEWKLARLAEKVSFGQWALIMGPGLE